MKRFLGRPQLLALAIALLVAAPVLILGQASEDETRARHSAANMESAKRAVETVSANFTDQLNRIRGTLTSLALGPNSEDSPIGLAAQRRDIAALQAFTDSVLRLYPRPVLRSYIALRDQAASIYDGTIVAASPPGTDLVGRRLADLTGVNGAAVKSLVANGATFNTGALSDAFAGTSAAPSQEVVLVTIAPRQVTMDPNYSASSLAAGSIATIIAELDFSKTFADAVSSSLALGEDAYVLDAERHLVARALKGTDFPLRDLSADPFVLLLRPSPIFARADVLDPLGAGIRLVASTNLSGISGTATGSVTLKSYAVLLLRDTAALDHDVDAGLALLAMFRLVVVGLLFVLAYLTGLAATQLTSRAVDRERLRLARDLHDLLGHSLSLIAIKSQLAHRLLPPGDRSGAASELSDIERVARDSLGDVRHAVDGYRQPTLRSAVAGARAALAAAGIASTVEDASGELPAALDAMLAWAVREGVTNVIRHSHAAACAIRLFRESRAACLEITDNGAATPMNTPGNGLRGLEERLAAHGGHADAGPVPGGGFRLRVSVPLGTS